MYPFTWDASYQGTFSETSTNDWIRSCGNKIDARLKLKSIVHHRSSGVSAHDFSLLWRISMGFKSLYVIHRHHWVSWDNDLIAGSTTNYSAPPKLSVRRRGIEYRYRCCNMQTIPQREIWTEVWKGWLRGCEANDMQTTWGCWMSLGNVMGGVCDGVHACLSFGDGVCNLVLLSARCNVCFD